MADAMQTVLGYMRRAVQEFDLIQDGDAIAVGVSGGKDSLVLLEGLVRLQRFARVRYTVKALAIDPRFDGKDSDYSGVSAMCERLGVPFTVKKTEIAEVVFNIRKEKCPCSLCAKMRRGSLHEATVELGCNKIALGHHYNDVIETFLMNLYIEGRIACFAPKSYLSKRNITLIRPLCLIPEADVARAAAAEQLPVHKSACKADGNTQRQKMKEYIEEMEKTYPGFGIRIFNAMRKANVNDWGYPTEK